jgi:hypothetical protein
MPRSDAIELRPAQLCFFFLAVFSFVVIAIIGRDYVQRSRARIDSKTK